MTAVDSSDESLSLYCSDLRPDVCADTLPAHTRNRPNSSVKRSLCWASLADNDWNLSRHRRTISDISIESGGDRPCGSIGNVHFFGCNKRWEDVEIVVTLFVYRPRGCEWNTQRLKVPC